MMSVVYYSLPNAAYIIQQFEQRGGREGGRESAAGVGEQEIQIVLASEYWTKARALRTKI